MQASWAVLCLCLLASATAEEVFVNGRQVQPALPLTAPAFLETGMGKKTHVCARTIPNVRGVLKATCCKGMQCGYPNGICCQHSGYCCPAGTACVHGDKGTPPGCLHVMDAILKKYGAKSPLAAKQAPCGTPGGPPCPTTFQPPQKHATPAKHTSTTHSHSTAHASGSAGHTPTDQSKHPNVIKDPTAVPCHANASCHKKDDAKTSGKGIVYEDAFATHNRNAFSQYHASQTTKFHAAMRAGKSIIDDVIKARKMEGTPKTKPGKAQPPLPPSVPVLNLQPPPTKTRMQNSLAGPSDPQSHTKVHSNAKDGYVTVKQSMPNFPSGVSSALAGQNPTTQEKHGPILYNLKNPATGKVEPFNIQLVSGNEPVSQVRSDKLQAHIKPSEHYSPPSRPMPPPSLLERSDSTASVPVKIQNAKDNGDELKLDLPQGLPPMASKANPVLPTVVHELTDPASKDMNQWSEAEYFE